MTPLSATASTPLVFNASTEAKTYMLFALAIALTAVGVFAGMTFALPLIASGWLILLVIVSLGIVFTAPLWANHAPMNMVLFAGFPFISGLTFTPYLISFLATYVNAPSILLNALAATACMSVGAAFYAKTTQQHLGVFGRAMFLGLVGLIVFGLFQLFIPSLRTGMFEVVLSGCGIALFAGFMAYDIQRIQHQGALGASPFLMALSLYLDVYNLFLYILRFMTAISGSRRR